MTQTKAETPAHPTPEQTLAAEMADMGRKARGAARALLAAIAARAEALAPRLLLHALSLELPHPATQEPIRFTSACPF